MTDNRVEIIARMIINTMANRKEKTWELYERYKRERYLHVTVEEILKSKGVAV